MVNVSQAEQKQPGSGGPTLNISAPASPLETARLALLKQLGAQASADDVHASMRAGRALLVFRGGGAIYILNQLEAGADNWELRDAARSDCRSMGSLQQMLREVAVGREAPSPKPALQPPTPPAMQSPILPKKASAPGAAQIDTGQGAMSELMNIQLQESLGEIGARPARKCD